MFLDARRDREDVRIENDVLGRQANFINEQAIGALTDFLLARGRVGLSRFIESHDHDCRAMATAEFGVLAKLGLAFLEADRVHNRLALQALEPGFDHAPLGRVDHDRDAGDVRLCGEQVQKPHHGRLRVEHSFVHVDVDDLGAVFHLLARDGQSLVVLFLADQSREPARAGDVGALTDVHEQGGVINREGLESRQAAGRGYFRDRTWLVLQNRICDRPDVIGRCAATAPDDVQEPRCCELADHRCHVLRAQIVLTELVRQASVGVSGHVGLGNP